MDPYLFVEEKFPLSLNLLTRQWKYAASALYSILAASTGLAEFINDRGTNEEGLMHSSVMALNHVIEAMSVCVTPIMIERYTCATLRSVRGACGEAMDDLASVLLLMVHEYVFQVSPLC